MNETYKHNSLNSGWYRIIRVKGFVWKILLTWLTVNLGTWHFTWVQNAGRNVTPQLKILYFKWQTMKWKTHEILLEIENEICFVLPIYNQMSHCLQERECVCVRERERERERESEGEWERDTERERTKERERTVILRIFEVYPSWQCHLSFEVQKDVEGVNPTRCVELMLFSVVSFITRCSKAF